MILLGVDIGFSNDRDTCCSCVLEVSHTSLNLLENPKRFCIEDRAVEIRRIVDAFGSPTLVGIDAPLTPMLISQNPRTGRMVDKVFSRGPFSNGRRGPQPGSIATPRQGWPLYCAGMRFRQTLEQSVRGLRYVSFCEIHNRPIEGAIEVIPKLTQALLLPPNCTTERPRGANIDESLFLHLFGSSDSWLQKLPMPLLPNESLLTMVGRILKDPHRHHEEIGAFVAAYQTVCSLIGGAVAIGSEGEHEGYFSLPRHTSWHEGWQVAYEEIRDDNLAMHDIVGNLT
jgi:hypothetical protein